MLKQISSNTVKEHPLVSVLIPVYNGERYLGACLDSILGQTLKDLEVICIDDCSTDDSLSILRDYAERDRRISVYQSTVNSGVDCVMNRGMELLRGRYAYFIGDDDLLELNALDVLVREAEWFDLDFVVFDYKTIYETEGLQKKFYQDDEHTFQNSRKRNIFSGPELYEDMIREGAYHPECSRELWRCDFLEKYHIRFGEGMERPYGDHIFFFHAMLRAKRVKYIPQKLYIYRRHNEATTVKVRERTSYSLWQDFRSILSVCCERMNLLGDESLPREFVKFCITDEHMRWITRLETWYRQLDEPNLVPFKNPMHEYFYRFFSEKMDKEMKFEVLVRLMRSKHPLLAGNQVLRDAACCFFDMPKDEYIVIPDGFPASDGRWVSMLDGDVFPVFFTPEYGMYKRVLKERFSMEENMDFMDGRALLY